MDPQQLESFIAASAEFDVLARSYAIYFLPRSSGRPAELHSTRNDVPG
jgi:hypothetical protein